MTRSRQPFKRVRPALGTLVEVRVEGVARAKAVSAVEGTFAEIARLAEILSAFDPGSELSRLNRATAGNSKRLSAELAEVLHLGAAIEAQSGGAFRLMPECPHPPGACYRLTRCAVRRAGECRFDLGGIAKGWVIDRAFERLARDLGPRARVVVNAGGDLRASHAVVAEIRVPGPHLREARYRLKLREGALATSALAAPRVGRAAARFAPRFREGPCRAASVWAQSCAVADAFTKIALFGKRAAPEAPGVYGVLRFGRDGRPLP